MSDKPCYCLGQTTIERVSNEGQLQTDHVDFVAADELFHKDPYALITKLTKENSELRAKLERADAELVAMRSDLATSNSKRDSAEACGAEMRHVLGLAEDWIHCPDYKTMQMCAKCLSMMNAINHALSTQCGVGLLEKVKRLREALSAVMKLIDDGILVRDTRNDSSPTWVIPLIPVINTLADAKQILAETEAAP